MSELNFKDYAGYYIGCKVRHEFVTKTKNIELRDGTLTGIDTDGIVPCCWVRFNYNDRVRLDSIKPILRCIDDIIDKEWVEIESEVEKIIGLDYLIGDLRHNFLNEGDVKCRFGWSISNVAVNLMRKKSIDMDGLLENSLAIDSKTLTQNQ